MSEKFTPEQLAVARQKFAEGTDICPFCGGFHLRFCPRVQELELDPGTGRMKRVVYRADGEWSDEFVVWPEMVADDEAEEDEEHGRAGGS